MKHFKTPRDVVNYVKELFLKASSPEEFSEDFYQFAFQDSESMLDDGIDEDGNIPFFNTLTEAKEKLLDKNLEEGFKVIITPKKKKPVMYSFDGEKFVLIKS